MKAALLVFLVLSASLLPAQDARIEEVGKSPVEAKFPSGGRIRMDLCSGAIDLVGRDEDVIRVSYHSDRGDWHDNVKIRIQSAADRADLKITDCPHNNFKVSIEVPKSSGLYIRMFAGQLDVHDITGDKNVELSFGQLDMDIGRPDDIAHLDGSVNSGQVDAPSFDISKGGLFRSFDRNGPGKYRVHAHVGAGQIDLR